MFCGLLPWTWFASSLTEASGVLISGGNLIKKVLFPAEILPIVTVTANMIHFFLALPILVGVPDLLQGAADGRRAAAVFPLVVLVQFIFTLACALILSALTVHFRDIKDILSNVLTLWFFATPIIYSVLHDARERAGIQEATLDLNPFTHLAISYQEILFFDGRRPLEVAAALGVASVGYFSGCSCWARRRSVFFLVGVLRSSTACVIRFAEEV